MQRAWLTLGDQILVALSMKQINLKADFTVKEEEKERLVSLGGR